MAKAAVSTWQDMADGGIILTGCRAQGFAHEFAMSARKFQSGVSLEDRTKIKISDSTCREFDGDDGGYTVVVILAIQGAWKYVQASREVS